MSEIQFLSVTDFNKIIVNGVVVIDFSAPWSSPCRLQTEIIKQLEKAYNGKATFLALNLDKNAEIALNLAIQSVPSVIVFKNGKEIRRFVGLQPNGIIQEAVDRALHLRG
jgi:thioredoxin 1